MSVNIYGMNIPVENKERAEELAAKLVYLAENDHISFYSTNGVLSAETSNDVIRQLESPKKFTAEQIIKYTLSFCHPSVAEKCDRFAQEYTVLPSPRFVKVCGRVIFVKDDTDVNKLEADIEALDIKLVREKNIHNITGLIFEHDDVKYRVGYCPRQNMLNSETLMCIEDIILSMSGGIVAGDSYLALTHVTKSDNAVDAVMDYMKSVASSATHTDSAAATEAALYLARAATCMAEEFTSCFTPDGEIDFQRLLNVVKPKCANLPTPFVDEDLLKYTLENLKRARYEKEEEEKNDGAKRVRVEKGEEIKEEK